mmetsp:Transcript_5599/g.12341  ORF Transcript_5599/g.12341 Transcript_5599/m.12341 type:complete len:91 (-) Transcript_5599:110-382(-)|eukprot:CAMPEP_0183350508 /NCGR_PEP_ID=MMETSP0164_2-20130417/19617_1 /TAXON_ID=221442 /ORGANISM="Coccolithus pelagicus ssp braarudi, Strain PLY182g" /LENGTH=90 /DNA_ID=CAMNT_0025522447 /DNA_START=59 /DNA_END=331 /DNA_ORIENTATION=+
MDSNKKADLYIPRKCSATHRLIHAKDHSSVQLNVGHLDENGVYTKEFTTFVLGGFIRKKGEADQSLNVLAAKRGLMKDLQKFPTSDQFDE